MRRIAPRFALLLLVVVCVPARGQLIQRFRDNANLRWIDHRLAGTIDDYTQNHDQDRRLFSPILGMPRDLYVYLPPGYTPARQYPLILYFHMSYVDEHTFIKSRQIQQLDRLICQGKVPPVIVACPDGTYSGENSTRSAHSLYVNGLGGRVEDHVMNEVVPFLMGRYSIRPERQSHALLGASAGGFGAASLAIRRRDFFGAVATLAAPLNLRYSTVDDRYAADFDPATYRWKTTYDPEETAGVFYFGLGRTPAQAHRAGLWQRPGGGRTDRRGQPGRPAVQFRVATWRVGHLRQLPGSRQLELRCAGRVVRLAGRQPGHRRRPGARPMRSPRPRLLRLPSRRRVPLAGPPHTSPHPRRRVDRRADAPIEQSPNRPMSSG